MRVGSGGILSKVYQASNSTTFQFGQPLYTIKGIEECFGRQEEGRWLLQTGLLK